MQRSHREKSANIQAGQFSFRIKGISRFDLRDPYSVAVGQTWPQFLLALMGLYMAVNLIFATLYTLVPGAVANVRRGDFLDAFFFSFETLATVGYGDMYPTSLYGHIIASAEIVCGVAFTAILTGLTFVRFSRPKAKFVFPDSLVITTHNGRPTLMLRIGNGRPGVLADVRARINVLITEISSEGNSFRRTHDLPLARQQIPILPLAWTLMHDIDETSPIFGMDSAALITGDTRFYVSIEARDPALGATVYGVIDYVPEQVAFNMHYADAIVTDTDGTMTMDLSQISALEPDSHKGRHTAGLA
jgi:inward rectifier potassium channel